MIRNPTVSSVSTNYTGFVVQVCKGQFRLVYMIGNTTVRIV